MGTDADRIRALKGGLELAIHELRAWIKNPDHAVTKGDEALIGNLESILSNATCREESDNGGIGLADALAADEPSVAVRILREARRLQKDGRSLAALELIKATDGNRQGTD